MSVLFPRITLVIGGAASGKSRFAERLVTKSGLPRTYIATAQAFDAEMQCKIARHQKDRGENWTTIEEPLELAESLSDRPDDTITLVDCATLWLSNVVLAERDPLQECTGLLSAIEDTSTPLVIVSNEVGQGIVPETSLGRRFREAQGRLNQDIAARADLVVLVIAGLPMVLKGQLPEGLT